MLALFIIIPAVVVFTIIISIISNKKVKESGKHFAYNKENNADSQNKKNISKISDSNSNETSKKSYNDNVKSSHDEDELKEKKLREQLGLFDTSIYNNLFSPSVRERGEVYFKDGKISNFSQSH